jgi:hypothetical protein
MKFHIDCRCGCDVLCIEKTIEASKEQKALYYFNMYHSYDKGGFWYRLKCAWKYFRHGEFAWSDMTLEDKDIDNLINFLQDAKESDVVEE